MTFTRGCTSINALPREVRNTAMRNFSSRLWNNSCSLVNTSIEHAVSNQTADSVRRRVRVDGQLAVATVTVVISARAMPNFFAHEENSTYTTQKINTPRSSLHPALSAHVLRRPESSHNRCSSIKEFPSSSLAMHKATHLLITISV